MYLWVCSNNKKLFRRYTSRKAKKTRPPKFSQAEVININQSLSLIQISLSRELWHASTTVYLDRLLETTQKNPRDPEARRQITSIFRALSSLSNKNERHLFRSRILIKRLVFSKYTFLIIKTPKKLIHLLHKRIWMKSQQLKPRKSISFLRMKLGLISLKVRLSMPREPGLLRTHHFFTSRTLE